MDDTSVLARLDRIGVLDRSGAAPGELLAELRGLLCEAEQGAREQAAALARCEGGGRAPRQGVARDIIGM